MDNITQEQLDTILSNHVAWSMGESGKPATLTGKFVDLTFQPPDAAAPNPLVLNLQHLTICPLVLNLQNLTIEQAIFVNCTFDTIHFRSNTWRFVKFLNCTFKHCIWKGSSLSNVEVHNSHITHSIFLHNQLKHLDFASKSLINSCDFEHNFITHWLSEETCTVQNGSFTNNQFHTSMLAGQWRNILLNYNTINKLTIAGHNPSHDNRFYNNHVLEITFTPEQTMIPLNQQMYTHNANMEPLPEGELIGYAVKNNQRGSNGDYHQYLVRMAIPKKAKRSKSTGRKCRAEYVRVLQIQPILEHGNDAIKLGKPVHKIVSNPIPAHVYHDTTYEVGKITKAHKWDQDRWHECAPGIHFFLTKEEALAFNQ